MLLPGWLLTLMVNLPASLLPPRDETDDARQTRLIVKLVALVLSIVVGGVIAYLKMRKKETQPLRRRRDEDGDYPPEREARGDGARRTSRRSERAGRYGDYGERSGSARPSGRSARPPWQR